MKSYSWGTPGTVVAVLVTGIAVLYACAIPGTGPLLSPEFQNVSDDVQYVGDAECASCHEEEFLGYQTHGMAKTFGRLTADNTVEDFSGVVLHHEQTGYYYVARRDGDQFLQEEYRLSPTGAKTHQLVRTMDYIIGSGSAARTYLTEIDRRLYELPLTWYPQDNEGEGRWDFSPGYEVVNGRFGRAIPPRCMACHNGTSQPVDHVEGMYSSLAQGIGCEQCHGPGQLHVEARLSDPEPADSIDLTIVNPTHLPIELRMDVCRQCHTTGAVSILREGESSYSYRPSQPLDQHLAIFGVETRDSNTIGLTSHAERMMKSQCFAVSQTMDCVTCHNPHQGFREYGPEYFNETCQDCHSVDALQAQVAVAARPDHNVDANCFSCHMPSVAARGVPHASFTDHYVRIVRNDSVSVSSEQNGELELRPYFEKDRDGEEAAIYAGMAYVVYGKQKANLDAMERGVALLAEALAGRPDLGEAQYLLGFARLQMGQATEAIPALEESIRLNPNVPERLNTLAQALERIGRDPVRIEQLYRQALEIQPAQASIRVNFGRFLEANGNLAEALTEYRRASDDEPWLAAAHYNLGTVLVRSNQGGEGERSLRQAIQLNPDHSDALTNLGILVASRGDADVALSLFRRAVEADPQNANALANFGTFLLHAGQFGDAIQYLQRAVEVNPRHVDALANLALALSESGNTTEARNYAQQALSIDPTHPTARQVMALR